MAHLGASSPVSPGSSATISANTTGSVGGVSGVGGLAAAARVGCLAGGVGSRISEYVSGGIDPRPRSQPPPLTRLVLLNVGIILKL